MEGQGGVHESRGAALKTLATRLAQLAATVVVTWFVADRAGLTLDELRAVDPGAWDLRWPRLVLSCAVLLGGYGLSGYLWGRIVRGLGGRRLGVATSIRLYMIANLGRYVPGKIWQLAAMATLARQQGIATPAATASAVLLQGLALGAAALLGSGALWTLAGDASWRWAVPAVAAGAVLLGLTPRVFDVVTAAWFRVTKVKNPPTLGSRHVAGWLGLAVINWLVYAGAFWVMIGGLGLDMGLLAATSAFAAAYVLGYVAIFAPAGVGVREASLVAFLSPQLGPGTAGAVAVVARLWTTAVEVVPAGAFWGVHVARSGPMSGEKEGSDNV